MTNNFNFPKQSDSNPRIYVYELPNSNDHKGYVKIGYTTRTVAERIHEQLSVLGDVAHNVLLDEPAIKNDGSTFTDKEIHRYLKKQGKKFMEFKVGKGKSEWCECTEKDVRNAIISIRDNKEYEPERIHDFPMRPEQIKAVEKTSTFFKKHKEETPHFLWNAKMRFGKTFTAYQLAKKMDWKKVLVLTFKPAVQSAWEQDLLTHKDFENWEFISKDGKSINDIDNKKPFVWFASLQDVLGKNSAGGIKVNNEDIHTTNWDCVIFDEYHYGAWRENSKELFEDHLSAKDKQEIKNLDLIENNEKNIPITTNHYLYLSGTPFKAIENGEFIEDQIYNWTYSDEQKAKNEWDDKQGENPYKALPRMVLMTYDMPEDIKQVARDTDFNEFDLNAFFTVNENGKFKYQDYIQKWLDLIRGDLKTTIDSKKAGAETPPLPFSDVNLLSSLNHTFWFLPNVASCKAMAELLQSPQNTFYNDYKVIVCAGTGAGIGVNALEPVQNAMKNPTKTKTITLSCGKLTTGVSVKPWGGIFMLRNLKSPETYFQSAFRVQTPWEIASDENPNAKQILKQQCYVFDFAPNRALKQISDYSCRLDINESNPEKKVTEFINFLPVLAYKDGVMTEISAQGILDIAMSGTSATMLARRWESALLVNVDNMTLSRLLKNEQAMQALMSIEGFRSLNSDIETIIKKSEDIQNVKAKANEKELNTKEKKQLSEDEKEYKSKRKQIQEKLIKFSTRIPIFMYLSDYREQTLQDVITKLEPALFKKVTGLTVKDFELLSSLGLFNTSLMNDAVYKFKRHEDSSLGYTGIERVQKDKVGGFDTVITKTEYKELY